MQSFGPYPGAHLGARISAYVDGALDDSERKLAQAHLADCEECRAQVLRQRHLKKRMNCLAMAAPSAALVAALADRACVQEHVERIDHRRHALVHAAVTVGSLCASLTVVGLVAGGSAPAAPGTPSAPAVVSTPRVTPTPLPTLVRQIGQGVAAAADLGAVQSSPAEAGPASLFTLPSAMPHRPASR